MQIIFNWAGGHLEGVGMTMTTLARFLGLMAGRPVVDKTGYAGMVDIDIEFTPANKVGVDADGPPSIFDVLPARLGLRLQPERGGVDVLVVDGLERPSEN